MKKIGVALGGGGVRGLAHVPALEIIDACGIAPAAMTGTSMGAIIGALYASGLSGKDIRQMVEQYLIKPDDRLKDVYRKRGSLLKWLGSVRVARKGGGLLNAERFLQHLFEGINVKTFEELKIPLRVVATDFYTGHAVVFDRGDLLPAIQASMSIPGIFVPVQHQGSILVDGGMANNLPYDLLPEECNTTIAIDVSPTRQKKDTEPPNMFDATLGMFDILVEKVTESMLKNHPPSIYVHPRLVDIRVLDFQKTAEVLEQARPAMDDFRVRLTGLAERMKRKRG